jgi:hypothetical protein
MKDLQYSAGMLAPLTGLGGLKELNLDPMGGSTEGLNEVCQLTQLKQLWLWGHSEEGLLLRLTQLRQLTKLECSKTVDGEQVYCKMGPRGEQQRLRFDFPRRMLFGRVALVLCWQGFAYGWLCSMW